MEGPCCAVARSRFRRLTAIALVGATLFGCGSHDGSARTSSATDGGVSESGGATSAGGSGGTASGAGGALIAVGGAAGSTDADAGCRRDVTAAAVALEGAQPFDLVIVADNSDSLGFSRDDLSAGLRDFLSNVKDRDVRVFLLTSTQYGASSAASQLPLVGGSVDYADPGTGKPYANPMTSFSVTCTDANGNPAACPTGKDYVPYNATGTWQFDLPKPIAVISPGLSDADFAAQQKAVVDGILTLGGGGSPVEQPVCTLARYIGQAAAVLPKNAVFLIISDEDDVSLPKECLSGFTANLRANGASSALPCSSGCDAYRYTVRQPNDWQSLHYHCAAFDDVGNQIANTTTESWLNQSTVPSCDGFTPRQCTDAESQQASPFCDSGKKLVDCRTECESGEATCSVDLPTNSVDACAQSFTKDGTQYASVADYCTKTAQGSWSGCASGGIRYDTSQPSFSGGYSPIPVAPGTSTGDIIQYFRSHADSAFGKDHYMVEGVVLEPSFSCKLGPGQSYAKNLSSLVGDQSKLFPLCEPYADALSGVWDFAKTLVQTKFSLSLKKDEHLTSVHVIGQNSADRVLSATDYTYDPATETVTVEASALLGTDRSLRFEITSDCRPIIR